MNDNERWLWAKLEERGMVEEVIHAGVERFEREHAAVNQPHRRGYIPLPAEVRDVIEQAETATSMAASGFRLPPCGSVFPGVVAGESPVRCDRLKGHTRKIKHRNSRLRVAWWGDDVAS